jgi:hypothetical protein
VHASIDALAGTDGLFRKWMQALKRHRTMSGYMCPLRDNKQLDVKDGDKRMLASLWLTSFGKDQPQRRICSARLMVLVG